MKTPLSALLTLLATACTVNVHLDLDTGSPKTPGPLPVAVSNNAVASVGEGKDLQVFSLTGLVNGTSWRAVSDRAFVWKASTASWSEIDPVPGGQGRLAATAAAAGNQIYFFGGYTVAEDGTEVSTPEVYRLDPQTLKYHRLPDMPVPVDDTVAAVFRDRYIYLVSGWHNTNNVDRVQVFDVETHTWAMATSFPGEPVFGHSGAIAGNQLVICDGVKVVPPINDDEKRSFSATAACFEGAIDRVDPLKISWRQIPAHSGPARYRAAAGGRASTVTFAGGSDNPYNFDGVGYDGERSQPSDAVAIWHVGERRWIAGNRLPEASMDHRNLTRGPDGAWLIVGGMDDDGPRRKTSVIPLRQTRHRKQ